MMRPAIAPDPRVTIQPYFFNIVPFTYPGEKRPAEAGGFWKLLRR